MSLTPVVCSKHTVLIFRSLLHLLQTYLHAGAVSQTLQLLAYFLCFFADTADDLTDIPISCFILFNLTVSSEKESQYFWLSNEEFIFFLLIIDYSLSFLWILSPQFSSPQNPKNLLWLLYCTFWTVKDIACNLQKKKQIKKIINNKK